MQTNTFNLWTMVAYPEELILLRLVLGVASFMVFGVIVAVVLDKYGPKVAQK